MEADKLEHRITTTVIEAVLRSTENFLREFDGEPAWSEPLVGFARGDDPLFAFLKQDIGEFYWTPDEIFALAFDSASAVPAAGLTVLSWVIPQTEATKNDQRRETRYAAKRWVYSRAFWPEFSRDVHAIVVDELAAIGIRAVAPEMSPRYGGETSERYGFASRWSQRHTAHVAGLGTFGLSDGLITPVGMAMRAGSIVAECRLTPTPRRYEQHQDWCPFYVDGSCGECIERCPAGAITTDGHDKVKCAAYLRTVEEKFVQVEERESGCGLCQSGVRCESAIPTSIPARVP